jgi:hypothetical protein
MPVASALGIPTLRCGIRIVGTVAAVLCTSIFVPSSRKEQNSKKIWTYLKLHIVL